ncbi:MAG: arylsulfotransferase family protein [Bradymonadaceae bacterium]
MASETEVSRSAAMIGLTLLAFIAGAWSATLDVFPYEQLLEPSFRAVEAYSNRVAVEAPANSQHWSRLYSDPRGVGRRLPSASWGEYTVYTAFDSAAVYMVDHCGRVVHVWHAPFGDVWPDPDHVRWPVPDAQIRMGAFDVTADGAITAVYEAQGDTPYGYGVARLNARSEVVWRAPVRAHHDVDVLDDGSVVTLAHRWRNLNRNPAGRFSSDSGRILEAFVVRLSPDGEVIGRYSLIDALVDSAARRVVVPWFQKHEDWDPLHANGVAMIGEDFAEHHEFAEPGQVLVSMRGMYAIGLVDLQKGTFVWLRRGGWVAQHEPDPLPNGRIMLFDNYGHAGGGGLSRILEFDPGTKRVTWSFAGTREFPIESGLRGGQSQLPNGNVLIVESDRSRILEVTREWRVVWSFEHPVHAVEAGKRWGPILAGTAERFGADELEFTPYRPPTSCPVNGPGGGSTPMPGKDASTGIPSRDSGDAGPIDASDGANRPD